MPAKTDLAAIFIVYLSLPEDLQDCVRFAYDSGWRKGAITQLERRDVHDGVIRLRPQSAKKKDGRMLALVGAIGEIITCRRAVQRPETPLVFYRIQHGKVWPVERFDKA